MEKRQKLGHVKGINAESKTITALVSTTQWDRMDERFAKGAWNLQDYLKNAVVLWAHDSGELPIAKTLNIVETEAGLQAEMQFDTGSPRAMDIFRLYKEGFLNAFSVGFIPKKWEMQTMEDNPEHKGLVFLEAELFEYSAVPVPANPGALVPRAMMESMTKTLGDGMFKKVAGEGAEETFMVVGPEDPEKPTAPEAAPESSPPADVPTEPAPESPAPTPDVSLETQLKYLTELAKTTKASGLNATRVKLVEQTMVVLQEILDSYQKNASGVRDLQAAIEAYGTAIKALFPNSEKLMEKVLKQVDKALEER